MGNTVPSGAATPDIATAGIGLLWLLLAAMIVLYIGYGAVIAYHWFKYSQDAPMATLTVIVYACIGVGLSAIMAGSLVILS